MIEFKPEEEKKTKHLKWDEIFMSPRFLKEYGYVALNYDDDVKFGNGDFIFYDSKTGTVSKVASAYNELVGICL